MTASVTGCSTWMRPFSSRKKNASPSSTNSAVPALAVADRARERDRGLAASRARSAGSSARSGRLLEHLLVAPLDRAVALAERDHRPVRVARGAGSRRGAGARGSARRRRVPSPKAPSASRCAAASASSSSRGRADDAHPAAAAARRRLDEEREADLLRLAVGHDRHAGLARDPLRRELVAAEPQRLRRRADPGEPGGLDRLREVGVLGEEAVAGMDRVGAGLAARHGCAPRSAR